MDVLLDGAALAELITKKNPGSPLHQAFPSLPSPGATLWAAASSLPGLGAALASARPVLDHISFVTVDAASARKSALEGGADFEQDLAYRNFKRIAPKGVMITENSGFAKGKADVFSAQAFVSRSSASTKPELPMLDLQLEYRHLNAEIDESLLRAVAETKYILGPQVKELEDKLAVHLGAKHVIGVSSGTEALVLALRALAIRRKGREYFDRGDEIITTAFTFTATGDAILRAGATPVFVDIDPVTFNLDAGQVEACLAARGSKVVGILPVHLYGQPCDMDRLLALAKARSLFVVEDVAQAYAAKWRGQSVGTLGDAGTYSFFPSKNLGGFGDGGAVSTPDAELANMVRMLLKHGGKDKYNVDHIGYNARLDTLQAAILLPKLAHIDDFTRRRIALGQTYNQNLKGLPDLRTPDGALSPEAVHVYHQYTVRTSRRDALQAHLKAKGVDSMVYYPVPLHKMRVFDGIAQVFSADGKSLPHAETACTEVLSLPMEPLFTQEQAGYIVEQVRGFFA